MMKQWLQFIQNHWMLWLAFAVVAVLIIFEELKNRMKANNISAQEVILLLNRNNGIVVDLRNQKAFSHGHVLGSIHIEPKDLAQNLKKLEPHKSKTLILIGDTDAQAFSFEDKLRAQGYAKVSVLSGGISAWRNAQLPLTRI